MCGSRSDLVHRGDLAADELCGGHYDKEKKIWSLPRGILALLKAFFGHFPQFKSRPLGSLYREFEEIPESHLKVTEKPLKMSQCFCDICDIPVEW